jgi:hypothetical protein
MNVLDFNLSEYQILEEFTFEERVEQEEGLQFYTLEKQLADAYEKVISAKKDLTRFEKKEIKRIMRNYEELYNKFIGELPDGYTITQQEYDHIPKWISYMFAPSGLKQYSYKKQWEPLFNQENRNNKGYYSRMISALPRPFAEGHYGSVVKSDVILNAISKEETTVRNYLPPFKIGKTKKADNGSFSVELVDETGSEDTLYSIGYYIKDRGVTIPNPLEGHPFMADEKPHSIESVAPLKDLLPTMDTVMIHGVPITRDPYVEGKKYLDTYGISIQDISWQNWKARFPQAEEKGSPPDFIQFEFPEPDTKPPSSSIIKIYDLEYQSGISPRSWLANRIDGGELVIQLLRSHVGQHGSVAQILGMSTQPFEYPNATLEDGSYSNISYQEFLSKGVLRQTYNGKTNVYSYKNIPIEFLRQEENRLGYKDRITWKESTSTEVVKIYTDALKRYTPYKNKLVFDIPLKFPPTRDPSPLREEVEAILVSKKHQPEDKLKIIKFLIKDITKRKDIYEDINHNPVICQHTLEILDGKLEDEPELFLDTWTTKLNGKFVCISCGEILRNVLMLKDQVIFDDDESAYVHNEKVVTEFKIGECDFKTIHSLQSLFNMKMPADEMFFQLLAILGIFPDISQLTPILTFGREFVLKIKFEEQGVVGIVMTVILLQSHIPVLSPRKSFGSQPFVISGFPRDSSDNTSHNIVDSLLMTLKQVHMGFSTSATHLNNKIIKSIVTKPALVKEIVGKQTLSFISKYPDIQSVLNLAKEHNKSIVVPAPEILTELVPNIKHSPKLEVIKNMTKHKTDYIVWSNSKQVQYKQEELPLRKHLLFPESREIVEVVKSERIKTKNTPDADIRKRLKLESKNMNLLKDWNKNLTFATLLADLFHISKVTKQIREVDLTQDVDNLRDISRGFVYECLDTIYSSSSLQVKFNELKHKNISLVLLLYKYEDAVKQVKSLREQERNEFTKRMQRMSDYERAINKELLDRGLIPHIITADDRKAFADQREPWEIESEIGVGMPVEDSSGDIADTGNYGDHSFRQDSDYNLELYDDGDM